MNKKILVILYFYFILILLGFSTIIAKRLTADGILESYANNNYESISELYQNYLALYNKTSININLSEQVLEHNLNTFTQNLILIVQHNNNSSNNFKLGINQFTDQSVNELKNKFLIDNIISFSKSSKNDFLAQLPKIFEARDNYSLNLKETNIDWRDLFLTARNQGDCGSCWAFSSVGAIEGLRALKLDVKEYLSPQQLVDCDNKEKGCKGGWPSMAYSYISKAGGVARESDYEYKAANGECIFDSSLVEAKIENRINSCEEEECSENDLQLKLLQNGPMAVVIDAYNSLFFNYKEGIYDQSCAEPNHAIVLVGFGYNAQLEMSYWIIRNSWGETWGMNGYGYVKYDKNNYFSCNINRYGFQPKLVE